MTEAQILQRLASLLDDARERGALSRVAAQNAGVHLAAHNPGRRYAYDAGYMDGILKAIRIVDGDDACERY